MTGFLPRLPADALPLWMGALAAVPPVHPAIVVSPFHAPIPVVFPLVSGFRVIDDSRSADEHARGDDPDERFHDAPP